MRPLPAMLLALAFLALGCAHPRAAPEAAGPRVDHVVVVSVDGMGREVLQTCPAPQLRALMARGASTLSALTSTAKTLPSHVAMLTGVSAERHGVEWNDAFHGYPKSPTVFEVAKRHRPQLTTAMVAGKAKFATFARPGALDFCFVPEQDGAADDAMLGEKAAALVREQKPDVLVLHLPGVDRAGHASGWASPEQCQALAEADEAIGRVLRALSDAGVADQTAVIVNADHGGSGHTHNPTDGKSLRVPWIVAGPGIRAGFDLEQAPGLQVRVEDTFATACWLLGMPPEEDVDGRPVVQVEAPP